MISENHFCIICGWGIIADDYYLLPAGKICKRHSLESIARWENDGSITFNQRNQLCKETARKQPVPLTDHEIEICDTHNKRLDHKCLGCPFRPGWQYYGNEL